MAVIPVHGSLQNLSSAPDIAFQFQPSGAPWSSIAAAHGGRDEAYRAIGKICFIDLGDGKGMIEYMYKTGILLADLVPRYDNLETAVDYVAELEGIKADTQALKEQTENFKDIAKAEYEDKGDWNAATNSPPLTGNATIGQTNPEKPQRYTITVPGNLGFAIKDYLLGAHIDKGYLVQHPSGIWFYNSAETPALEKVLAVMSNTDQIYSQSSDNSFIVADKDGNVIFKITGNTIQFIGQITQASLTSLQTLLETKFAAATDLAANYNNTFYVTDNEGRIIFKASADGITYIGQVTQAAITALNLKIDNLSASVQNIIGTYTDRLSIADGNGNVIFEASAAGINFINKGSDSAAASGIPKPTLLSDYFQIIIYGQSLSVGGSFVESIDFFDSKTFTGGILTNYDPDTAGAANTYFGSALIALPATGTETQGKGLSRLIKQLIRDENKIALADQGFTPVVNAAGTGGQSWSVLSNITSDEYRRLLESVRRGKDFALAAGKSYSAPVLCYIQGENSGDRVGTTTEWYNKLDSLFTSLNTDIKLITGQTEDVQFLVYQIASDMTKGTGVPLAFLKIAQEKANVHFGCSMYQFDYVDALHVSSNATRIMGAMMGVVAKRAIVDKTKMLPISRISHTIQKNEAGTLWVIKMKMNVPVKPLVWDETINSLFTTAPAHKGFIIKNGSNVDIVTNVTISHGDTINVFCSANPAGLNMSYAIGGRDSGGNLRDSQGDSLTISCAGVNKRVDNWCPMFEQLI